MLSSKTLTGRITTSNTRLFAIRLEVSKATSMDIKHMILIANSLDFARKAIDFSVYSGQATLWLSVLHLDCSSVVALAMKLNSGIAQARLSSFLTR